MKKKMKKENASGKIEDNYNFNECNKTFGSDRGLMIHQGNVYKKQPMQCGPSDRKTRSKSSQEANHSEEINATAEACLIQPNEINGNCVSENSTKRPKILLWPAASEKTLMQNVMRYYHPLKVRSVQLNLVSNLGRVINEVSHVFSFYKHQ